MFVDDTACMKRAAKAIIQGAAYDNNLLCIGEKEVFALESIADKLMAQMEKNGAVRLNRPNSSADQSGVHLQGRPGRRLRRMPSVNKDFIGKDAAVLAKRRA